MTLQVNLSATWNDTSKPHRSELCLVIQVLNSAGHHVSGLADLDVTYSAFNGPGGFYHPNFQSRSLTEVTFVPNEEGASPAGAGIYMFVVSRPEDEVPPDGATWEGMFVAVSVRHGGEAGQALIRVPA